MFIINTFDLKHFTVSILIALPFFKKKKNKTVVTAMNGIINISIKTYDIFYQKKPRKTPYSSHSL